MLWFNRKEIQNAGGVYLRRWRAFVDPNDSGKIGSDWEAK